MTAARFAASAKPAALTMLAPILTPMPMPAPTPMPLATSTAGRWLERFDAVPPLAWLGLQAAALWPHWRWAAARVADGSDDPLGVAALAALVVLVWRLEPRLRANPRPGWLAGALLASLLATLVGAWAPPLLGAVFAASAMAAGLCAFMPAGVARLPLAGLALLALPVVSSLQFYAGYPLRVLTAEASTGLLQLAGLAAQRTGTAMVVEGRLIIVDAPCSGVQMVWMAYFCACAVAAFAHLADRRFIRRLPFVGVIVLCGNVLRNSVLVALEALRVKEVHEAALPEALSEAVHQGVGLAVLALVCCAVVALMRGAVDKPVHKPVHRGPYKPVGKPPGKPGSDPEQAVDNPTVGVDKPVQNPLHKPLDKRVGKRLRGALALGWRRVAGLVPWPMASWWATLGHLPALPPGAGSARVHKTALLLALGLCGAVPWLHAAAPPAVPQGATGVNTEWPALWEGRPLRPLALSAVEQRFAARFPGRMARLTDGEQVLVLRSVWQPTRMLHPAADCYRGLGYRIHQAQLERDAQARLWRCFVAERDGRRTRVCERIVDAQGLAFTDASSWFWAAQLGQSSGPWQAITTARAL